MLASEKHSHTPYISNLFDHEINVIEEPDVVNHQYYSSSSLCISQEQDVMLLHPDLSPLLYDIKQHYHRIGLKPSENINCSKSQEQPLNNRIYESSVYTYASPNTKSKLDKAPSVIDYLHSKNNFIYLATALGCDIPRTECYSSIRDVKLAQVRDINLPCYIKSDTPGGGSFRCESIVELIQNMEYFSDTTPIQIQSALETDRLINLQFLLKDNEVIKLSSSTQLLTYSYFQEDMAPVEYEPWKKVEVMAEWLKNKGVRGIISFKLAKVETEKGISYPIIKCTTRYRNYVYSALVARKLNISQWGNITINTRFTDLSDLDIKNIEYNKKSGEGVIIINWGGLLTGRITLLLSGSEKYRKHIASNLIKKLS